MQWLKQSTAATVLVGPVLDSAGAAVTSAVIGDFNITKNGSTAAMAAAASVTHSHNGFYLLTFTTGNTDTLGRLDISVNNAAMQMTNHRFEILAATTFDALVTNAAGAANGMIYNGANTGTVIPTVTTLTNLPAITANWLTTAGINDGAFTATKFASGAFDAVWSVLTSGMGTVGSIGKRIVDYLTGDAFARIGPNGSGLTDLATAAALATAQGDLTTLTGRLTAARAGYLDNLNVGGPVASNADMLALNQSASRRILLTTVGQYERPESGSTVYTIEARTFDGDGAATNADVDPTLTGTGQTSGSLAANIGAISNPATGVYRWTYTVAAAATVEPVRFDVSATMGTAFTLSVYSQVVDFVAATWTSTDASNLTAIFNKLPSRGYLTGSTAASGAIVTADVGLATGNLDTQFSTITAKTNNLPSDPADQSAVEAAITAATSPLATAAAAAAAKAILDKIDTGLVLDGAVWQFTVNMLELGPAGGGTLRDGKTLAEGVDLILAAAVGTAEADGDDETFHYLDGDPAFTTTFDGENNRVSVVEH